MLVDRGVVLTRDLITCGVARLKNRSTCTTHDNMFLFWKVKTVFSACSATLQELQGRIQFKAEVHPSRCPGDWNIVDDVAQRGTACYAIYNSKKTIKKGALYCYWQCGRCHEGRESPTWGWEQSHISTLLLQRSSAYDTPSSLVWAVRP